ncbi:MAG: phytanoyl-CoA dioxygenase family protein [Planctomycetes bacterium]|nr:phytanoyl-CoA dioxygenase family protein [Planctomycetota bacterium]MCB9918030.1 phytanoyl-CoA dioxygenase family protein [Planctomycetota bacterium]
MSTSKDLGGRVYRQAIADNRVLEGLERFPTFDELSEEFPDDRVPYLDRRDIDEASLTPNQKHWRDQGYVLLEGFLPEDLVDAYLDLRQRCGIGIAGWGTPVPYLYFREIRDLTCFAPLADVLRELIGTDMGMHFNIPMFQATERYWHQDDYLNPDDTLSWYAAVWMALGDIHPDCGPYEYVPMSHKWPCMRSSKVKAFLKPEARDVFSGPEGHWAQHAEVFTNPAYLAKLEDSGLDVRRFLGKKGDVLIWHGKLLHRGSNARNPEIPRPALITHYSAIDRRKDLGGTVRRHGHGGYYWDFPEPSLGGFWPDAINMDRLVRDAYVLRAENDRLKASVEASYRRTLVALARKGRSWLARHRRTAHEGASTAHE